MNVEMTGLCREHSFERAVDVCRRCGGEFCEICVVHPFGPKKPFCKECAMVQGGVRSFSPRPAMPGRMIRKRVKQFETRDTSDVPGRADTPEVVDPVLADWLETAKAEIAELESSAPVADVAPPPAPVPVDAPAPAAPATPADSGETAGDEAPIDWSRPFG